MSWVLGWLLGGGEGGAVTVDEEPVPPALIEVPVVPNVPSSIDHLSLALSRLCEYAKAKSGE